MGSTLTREIILDSPDEAIKLLGRNGELRKRIQKEASVRIVDRGTRVAILGEAEDTTMAGEVLKELLVAVRQGHNPTVDDVSYALKEARSGTERGPSVGRVISEVPTVLRRDIFIKPRTQVQRDYLDAIQANDAVLAIGPAGTGKTYLAMAAAVSALLNKQVNRIVLTRPAVEAGENLGFLPGDLREKVNPYLRPLYDALYAMVEPERVRKLFDREQVEVAPLAFMRGRTLSNCFAILDEAQNTTTQQMKMFLTRLGEGTRAVITGDVTQIDLPPGVTSGLVEAQRVLRNTEGVSVIHFDRVDVVRSRLVQNIIDAYDRDAGVAPVDPATSVPSPAPESSGAAVDA